MYIEGVCVSTETGLLQHRLLDYFSFSSVGYLKPVVKGTFPVCLH